MTTVAIETSTIPAVKAALIRALEQRPGLQETAISWGLPHSRDVKEYIALQDVSPADQVPAGQRVRPHSREETYDLEIQISVLIGGATSNEPTCRRAFELLAELEDELRNDLTVGGGAIRNGWAQVASTELRERGPDADGNRESIVDVVVHCRARLRGEP